MKRSLRKQMNSSWLLWLAGAVVTGDTVFGPERAASEEGDVKQGLALARRVCSGCERWGGAC
jgi:mono/diheme cytochrome c family protein